MCGVALQHQFRAGSAALRGNRTARSRGTPGVSEDAAVEITAKLPLHASAFPHVCVRMPADCCAAATDVTRRRRGD